MPLRLIIACAGFSATVILDWLFTFYVQKSSLLILNDCCISLVLATKGSVGKFTL